MPQTTLKFLFLIPYPPGQAPSQRFRFEQYLQFISLPPLNAHYDLEPFLDEKTWKILYQKGHLFSKITGMIKGFARRKLLMLRTWKYDLVFIHREAAPLGPPIFEWIIAKIFRKKIIYDFDDAIWLPNTSKTNWFVAGLKGHGKVAKICKWSYKISVGNEFLADFARQYNDQVLLNPTTIDTDGLHQKTFFDEDSVENDLNKKGKANFTIGWTGSHSTLPYLKLIKDALRKLEEKYEVRLVIIANQPPDIRIKNLEYKPWNKETEMADLLDFDVGIMPLVDDIWANGKCGFKALQYLSLGIPALVSPVGINTKIVTHGEEGFHCKTEADWVIYLEKLLLNPELRKEMGKKGRKKVEDDFSVKSNKENFLRLFK
ncbi:N/A [soil metagenome]